MDKKNLENIAALTPVQEGMLYHYLKEPEKDCYFEQLSLVISGRIDTALFARAWQVLVETNEMLRTVFRWEKVENPIQIVLKTHRAKPGFYDFSDGEISERERKIQEIKEKERQAISDLHEVPFRVMLCRREKDQYEMILTYHHILYDGWSNGIILREFFNAYNALSHGREPMKPVKTKFREFVKKIRQTEIPGQEKFWRHYLAGFDTPTPFPLKKKTGPETTGTGTGTIRVSLAEERATQVAGFVKKRKITLASLLYSAWAILLQRYANTDDVVFGTTVSGRSMKLPGIEDMVGLFINTLPLRVRALPKEKTGEMLTRIDDGLKKRGTYEYTPLVKIKEYSEIHHQEELFDSIVVLENYPLDKGLNLENHGLSLLSHGLAETSHYDLTIVITLFAGLDISFNYNKARWEEDTVVRLAGHFRGILENLAISPARPVSALEIIQEEEKRQVLEEFNDTGTQYPHDKSIQRLFAEQVEKLPDHVALVGDTAEKGKPGKHDFGGNVSLTYRQLHEQSGRLASRLRKNGVLADEIVAIRGERSLETIVGILAILEAGAAYLPIDPAYPEARKRYMLADCGVKILLTAVKIDSLSREGVVTPETFNKRPKGTSSFGIWDLGFGISPPEGGQLAYIIYTSGSTGKPKGTMVEHRSVIRLVKNTGYIEFKPGQRLLQTGALAFDASTFEIWGTQLNGLTLYLAGMDNLLSAAELKRIVTTRGINTMWLTAPLFNRWVEEDVEIFSGLGNLLVGGDLLSTHHISAARKRFPAMNLINGYGPTENTTFSTTFAIEQEYRENIPIGKPIANSTAYIIDIYGHLQPLGVPGELWVGGAGVARGYLNNPELTAERFVTLFNRSSRSYKSYIIYKTGDLARWLPDGNIEFLGRIDRQVKIRGFRIELAEIENLLLSSGEIKEAAVLVKEDKSGDKYLVAYIVPGSQPGPSGQKWRDDLLKVLPEYMVPAYFLVLEAIPLTPNGKIHRQALPEPGITPGTGYVPPRTETQRQMVKIWSGVLGIDKEKIGLDDHFFQLGGHSLKAAALISRIHKAFNLKIPLKEVFKRPTPGKLCEYMAALLEEQFREIEAVEKREYYRLSSAQQRLYYLQQLDPGSTVYNIPAAWLGKGNVDKDRLESIFRELIRRHESLRTSIRIIETEPVQRIREAVEFQVEDLSPRDTAIKDFLRPFTLSAAPLLRVGLRNLGNEYLLMLDLHHIISDGTSMKILANEFMALAAGETVSPLKIRYRDYSRWISGAHLGEMIKKQEAYWLEVLGGEPPLLELPTDYARSTAYGFSGDSLAFEIGAVETRTLNELALARHTTLFTLLFTLYTTFLFKLTNDEDIVVGTPIAGRRHSDLANLVGMLVNTLGLRLFPGGEKKLGIFLEEADKTTLKAFENQEYPFARLVEQSALHLNRDPGRNPVFDTMLVFQNLEIPGFKIPGNQLVPLPLETKTAKFDLTLLGEEKDGILHCTFEYRTGLFKRATIDRFTRYFLKIVSAAVGSLEVKLGKIEILPEEEKRQLLVDFNAAAREFPREKTLPHLFAEQVEQIPDHTVLLGGGTGFSEAGQGKPSSQVTYRELRERSHRLAGGLIERGTRPGAVVGIMVERSVEMITGILGILKAGGAYLPIDPEYPQNRIDFIMKDSSAKITLTSHEIEILSSPEAFKNPPKGTPSFGIWNLEFGISPHQGGQPAYIIYTSGSTGKPKGVVVEHGNVVRLVKDPNFIHAAPGQRLLLTGALVFDISTFEIWYPLLNGLTLVLTAQEVILHPDKLERLMVKENITLLHLIPQLFNQLAEEHLDIFKGLRYFLVGGDRVRPDYIERLRAAHPHVKILHMYGPTENTTFSTFFPVRQEYTAVLPIGKPIDNSSVYILNPQGGLQPIGTAGELCTGGAGVARGYLNNPELTAERFVTSFNRSYRSYRSYILYKTGDLARWLPDGNIEFLGRIDHQVKIRGIRIEPGEIETRLTTHEAVRQAVVLAKNDKEAGYALCAYVVLEREASLPELKEFLSAQLPGAMIPSYFKRLTEIPLTPTGKVDRRRLLSLETAATGLGTGVEYAAPRSAVERQVLETWREVLGPGQETMGVKDNFFDLGGHSLLLIRLQGRLVKLFQKDIPLVALFNHPTIASQARYLGYLGREEKPGPGPALEVEKTGETGKNGTAVAVIGIACRFPGARDWREFWNNLKNGVEAISFLSAPEAEELVLEPGITANPNFTTAKGRLAGNLEFDSFFFGYTPSEAGIMDPQVRIFHEIAWEALENAGYAPDTHEEIIGLYAGASANPFWEVLPLRDTASYAEQWNAVQFSDKDHLCTRIAYKLDLKGPAVSLQTACSTSLAAVDQACRGLLGNACTMALAGGVSVTLHDEGGYLYQEGTILSPEGHCRSFDARSNGTVGGNGAGAVVLKPLEAALKDKDTIYAVIKGSALNNDGKNRIGYTAPSAAGQAKAISAALYMAGIDPGTIGFIENHGTGTPLGDPIEIEGLKQAFQTGNRDPARKNYCALGTVKTNIGHLDAAAGIAGLIKTVLSLYHGLIPPCLHFQQNNPALDLENSPFYVNTQPRPWAGNGKPRRAGVSSFGLGGSNVHVVLEEAPGEIREQAPQPVEPAARAYQLILLSAKTAAARDKITKDLARHLKENPGLPLADVAYTLRVGRKAFAHRGMIVAADTGQAIRKLEAGDVAPGFAKEGKSTIIFMFSGQGSQYVNMGLDLYREEPVFRDQVDTCFRLLKNITGIDMKPVLYPGETGKEEAEAKIYQFLYTTPLKFIFEYSLASLLIAWGIRPDAMIGHSFGEYVAACLSGVFSLEDGLFLAALRGQLMHRLPPGAMLGVPLGAEELNALLPAELSLAAVNGENLGVVSGPVPAMDSFETQLNRAGHECIRYRVPKAGHSHMVEPIMAEFREKLGRVVFKQPQVPFISGMTGEWVRGGDVKSAEYWTRHLRETVRFADGLTTLFKEPNPLFLEVGPGRGLTLFVNQHPCKKTETPAFNLVRHKKEEVSDVYYTLSQVGYLWLHGVAAEEKTLYPGARRRVPLPTYPFESKYYPAAKNLFRLDAPAVPGAAVSPGVLPWQKKADPAEWFYVPTWEPKPPGRTAAVPAKPGPDRGPSCVLMFMDREGAGIGLQKQLEQQGVDVLTLRQGDPANPSSTEDYDEWITQLSKRGKLPRQVYHLWGIDPGHREGTPGQNIEKSLAEGFYSLLYLVRALGKHSPEASPGIDLLVVTAPVHPVTGEEEIYPENAPVYGLCKSIPQEYPGIRCRCIDVQFSPAGGDLLPELCSDTGEEREPLVAYRGGTRWVQVFKPLRLEKPLPAALPLKPGGVYFITGGTGHIGLVLARHLAKTLKAKLVLTGRGVFPPRETWDRQRSTSTAGPMDSDMSRKIRELLEIEELGAEVLVLTADVSHRQEMHDAFKQAGEKFGRIDGVIHSAGVDSARAYITLGELQKAGAEMHFHPKIYGLLVLIELLKEQPVDFCMVMSSTAAVLGGLGLGAYSAANCFMDAYVHVLNRRPDTRSTRWLSVNWDGWLRAGRQSGDTSPGSLVRQLAMTPLEGAEAFERVLAREKIQQVIQCSGDLHSRLTRWLNRETCQPDNETPLKGPSRQPRPPLDTPYEPPTNPVEQTLAGVWQELLGYERVGIHDNFFQLGGDSLKVVIASSKIHKVLNIKISLEEFFSNPTIAALSRHLGAEAGDRFHAIEPTEKKDYYPLSSTQKRMFILNQLEKNDLSYNNYSIMTLEGKTGREQWQDLFQELVYRHAILRTSFHLVSGEPVQRVHDTVEFAIEYGEAGKGQEAGGNRYEPLIKKFLRPFDLAGAPLLRVGFFNVAEDKHLLAVDMHHIVSDGTSLGLLVKEIMGLYRGETVSPPAIQYKDYALWQQRERCGERFERQAAYWLGELAGEVPGLRLPLDFDRPVLPDFAGRQYRFEYGIKETKALKELAISRDVTLYMVLLSVYMILLSQLGGQEDVVIGAPAAGRDHADVQGVIGMFVNTLVIRGFPVLEKSYRDFLMELKTRVLAAFENQDYPFEDLVEQKGGSGEIERNPLFDAAFLLQNQDIPEMEIPGLKLKPYDFDSRWSNFDLTLMAEETGETLRLALEYKTALFKPETVERLGGYYRKALASILGDQAQRLGEIKILSEAEQRQILHEFNDTAPGYPDHKTIHQLFAEQVERTPDNLALHGGMIARIHGMHGDEGSITYNELNEKSGRLARVLQTGGAGPDILVAIKIGPSVERIIGLLGILKSGGAYLPIDPDYPQERINYLLKDSGATLLVTNNGLEELPNHLTSQLPNFNLLPATSLAYIIYTSGTTGKPKGVLVEHRNAAAYIHAFLREFALKPQDTVIQLATYTFDIFIEEVFPILSRGGKLAIPAAAGFQGIPGVSDLTRFIRRHQVTIMDCTPLLLNEFNQTDPAGLSSIHTFISGGDVLKREYADRSLKTGILYNTYGPTETTVCATYYRCPGDAPGPSIPIGKPVAGYSIYILNRVLQAVPLGAAGELCISGAGVSRGYLNRPELTAERFVTIFNKSYRSYKSYISYRTGDLGRWLPDGNIQFLGRIDLQVKIRGYRIELAEIENTLRQHEGIDDALVVDREKDGDRFLCAYWVPAEPLSAEKVVDPGGPGLRAFLAGKLPAYMIPAYFIPLPRLPMTHTGKIDRHALPEPGRPNLKPGPLESTGVEPKGELELLIAETWKEVLKVNEVGSHDNFFDMGGNSLKILRVSHRLEERLAVPVPVVDLFRYPTIDSLRDHLAGLTGRGGPPPAQPTREAYLPGEPRRQSSADIAIIGMSGRFPGAKNLARFWENLEKGRESITFFTGAELAEAGVPRELLQDPHYVRARGILADKDRFDAAFFNYTLQEAQVMDPQSRLFHECAWEALEDAGYNPETHQGPIGLYAGASNNLGWQVLAHVWARQEMMNDFQALQLADSSFMTNWISYKLNLKGPAVFVQTACSTSLTAIHTAYNALLLGDCAMALAGGVTVPSEEKGGYLYQEGMVLSPDGHCRALDGGANGTVGGEGAAAVLLKPLEQARHDRDHIYAVIKASAVNNDGARKVGFSAPSVDGQAEAISRVLRRAGIPPESITYIETHGTGTSLGDPIEIEALKHAFNTQKKGFCALGSVKSNIGHLDSASGVVGFIKAVLALTHKQLPPTLHFEMPNPRLNLIDSPFYVNTRLTPWEPRAYPLRAGVSSFGIGGTNVHIVLEESPLPPLPPLSALTDAQSPPEYHLILLSAKTQTALDVMVKNLAEYLVKNPGINLADVAYTLQVGRKAFDHRWMTVCAGTAAAVESLTAAGAGETSVAEAGPGSDRQPRTLRQIGGAWLQGRHLDGEALYPEEKRYRLPLPTYPFAGQRYWIKGNPWQIKDWRQEAAGPRSTRKKDLADWFYIPRWLPSPPVSGPKGQKEPPVILILIDRDPLILQLVQRLRAAGPGGKENRGVITVRPGDTFKQPGDFDFSLNPAHKDDYRRLLTELRRRRVFPHRVVHTWNVTGPGERTEPGVIGPGFYSLLHLAAALGEQDFSGEIHLDVISTGVQEIDGNEELVPEKAAILGPLKVIPQEIPYIICRSIDIQLPPAGSTEESSLAGYLLREFSMGAETGPALPGTDIAYRRHYRWVKTYEPVRLDPPAAEVPVLRDRGVYLITGGCGGIGFTLAQYLAKQVRARLVLTGRSPLGSEETAEPKRLKLRQLEAAGGDVLYFSADVADKRRMAEVLAKAAETFGPLNGIIHTAGVTTGKSIACPVQEVGEAECREQFAPKIQGTLVLAELVRHRPLDFCWLVSSLSPLLGGLGFCAYSAANAFMDAFAFQAGRGGSTPWLSVNWADWDFPQESNTPSPLGASVAEGLITPAEGVATFERILTLLDSPVRQVAVSAGDLQTRIDRWVKLDSLRQGNNGFLETTTSPGQFQARPSLSTGYIAPRTPVEQAIATVWQQQLGFDAIGAQDDFFELGGDSLKAISMISKIHKELHARVKLDEFFARPTIATLAQYIAAAEKGEYTSIPCAEKRDYYVLAAAQKRLYLLDRMESLGTSYNMAVANVWVGELDRARLESAFAALIRRHESFRTSFSLLEDQPVQRIHDKIEFQIEDFLATEGKERKIGSWELRAKSCIHSFIRSFDLSCAPLLRVGLIKIARQEHIMIVDMHHIISDGVSHQVLAREFTGLYEGKSQPRLRLQYKDYAQWQDSAAQQESVLKQETYWLKELAGEIPVPDLPIDYARPLVRSFAGGAVAAEIGTGELSRLNALARSAGTTRFVVLLAAYNILLAKISGQEDLLVGTPTAGRRHADLEPIIGMFVNTLVLRNYPRAQRTYRDFLAEVKERTPQAFENQDYPFEGLVEKLVKERDTGRNPLFDTAFVLQSQARVEQPLPGAGETTMGNLSGAPLDLEKTASPFDLVMDLVEREEKLAFVFQYCSALFRQETILGLAGYFKRIIAAVLERPESKIADIEMLAPEEKRRLLADFNETATPYPADKTLQELFAEQAAKNPDRLALKGKLQITNHNAPVYKKSRGQNKPKLQNTNYKKNSSDVQLSYGKLQEKSHQVAYLLIQKGVKPDTIVGIMVERSIEMVIGILGILKAGGAYLPIDPEYPAERIDYMLKDSSAKILLTAHEITSFSQGRTFNFTTSTPTSLAYIIYTSGTTGKSRGTLTTHRNVSRVVRETNYIRLRRSDRVLQLSNYAFDGSTFDIYGALLNGAALVMIKKEDVANADRLGQILADEQITVFFLTTALFNTLVDIDLSSLSGVRKILFGGEQISVPHTRRALLHLGKNRIIHVYGPTETTVYATYYFIDTIAENRETIPIGQPLANTTAYILDRTFHPVPLGVCGELFIGGPGLARGYLNRPELTAEKFCLRRPGGRFLKKLPPWTPRKNFLLDHLPLTNHQSPIYQTGDLARWLPEGQIEFIGRVDHQVKIRGFRIEPGEIQRYLLNHPDIREAAVIAGDTGAGEKYLCAYMVVRAGFAAGSVSAAQLREYLSARLPLYMIPSYFIFLAELPLNSSGKVDKRALPEPDPGVPETYSAPADEIEAGLLTIWSEILSLPREKIGMTANFFELGGHSLKAAILMSRVHRYFNVKLSLRDIFAYPSARDLARLIKGSLTVAYRPLEPVEQKEYYPLSSAQKRLYIQQHMIENNTSYNTTLYARLEGEPEPAGLERVFRQLILRHENLRTSFHMRRDEPVQRVRAKGEFDLDFYDFHDFHDSQDSQDSQDSRDFQDLDECIRLFVRPFDLSQAPLLRVGLIREAESRYILMVDMHHIVTDGFSLGLLIKEAIALYGGRELAPLKLQYRDYAAWRAGQGGNRRLKEQEAYWLRQFTGKIPVLKMPLDFPRDSVRYFEGETIDFNIHRDLQHRLRQLASETGTTLFHVLLAAGYIVLAKYSGQEDIVAGTAALGRDHLDLQGIIGVFVNLLALRCQPAAHKTFLEFLAEVKEKAIDAYHNQDYPFEELVRQLNIQGSARRNPLFDVVFNFFSPEQQPLEAPGLTLEPYLPKGLTSRFDLVFLANDRGDTLELGLTYSSELFKAATAEDIGKHYLQVLEQVTAAKEIKLAEIKISTRLSAARSKIRQEKTQFEF